MALDLAMLDDVAVGTFDILVRTYMWSPWCVSLGRNQREDSISAGSCRLNGFDIVRRPTGGRAVLHANELTYAVALRSTAVLTPQLAYALIHEAIHAALEPLAPSLTFSGASTDLRTHYAASGALGQVCFTSHARSEIMWHTRKVVGSAQRVVGGLVLQHGSILCGAGHERIADVVAATDLERATMRASIERSSATLSEVAGRPITPNEVAERLSDLAEQVEVRLRRRFDEPFTSR
jgi:lipoate-protein ligase A